MELQRCQAALMPLSGATHVGIFKFSTLGRKIHLWVLALVGHWLLQLYSRCQASYAGSFDLLACNQSVLQSWR